MSGWTQEDLDRRNREVFGVGTTVRLTETLVAPNLMPEWMIEAECTKLLEQDGWRSLRTDPVSDRGKGKGFGELGMADHLYVRYAYSTPMTWLEGPTGTAGDNYARVSNSQVLWIEFKSAKGKPQKNQIDWHAKERARGALTWIAGVDFPASIEGFKAYYAASGLKRGA